jgi:hypothetical protein
MSWRRSSGDRRQQLKWLASGAAVTIICLFLAGSFTTSGGLKAPLVIVGLAWLGVAALPVSIGVGILKYRLYEIDRIICRTLAYAIVTGLLVGVYAGLVLLATQVFKFHSTMGPAGRSALTRYPRAGRLALSCAGRVRYAEWCAPGLIGRPG